MELKELKLYKGKVRDVYHLDNYLLIISTDRISAFDFVLKEEISGKGEILNQISTFWFNKTKSIIKNHFITNEIDEIKRLTHLSLDNYYNKRTMLCRKAKRIDFEFIVRGYLFGSGWSEYQKNKSISGIKLPDNLKYASRLPFPILTPTTKSDTSHDEPVDFSFVSSKIGYEVAKKIERVSIDIYNLAYRLLIEKGIILADTKFEFGFLDGELILIDELLTPDSSRFWELASYREGNEPVSYDKQFVRNYLLNTNWDKNSPPPPLTDEVIKKTIEKYKQIYDIILSIK